MNEIELVEIEVCVHLLDSNHMDYIATHNGREIKVDLHSFDLVDLDNEDVHGNLRLLGFWDEKNLFLTESFEYLH